MNQPDEPRIVGPKNRFSISFTLSIEWPHLLTATFEWSFKPLIFDKQGEITLHPFPAITWNAKQRLCIFNCIGWWLPSIQVQEKWRTVVLDTIEGITRIVLRRDFRVCFEILNENPVLFYLHPDGISVMIHEQRNNTFRYCTSGRYEHLWRRKSRALSFPALSTEKWRDAHGSNWGKNLQELRSIVDGWVDYVVLVISQPIWCFEKRVIGLVKMSL